MPNRRQVIIWTNDGVVHWHLYGSLGPQWVNSVDTEDALWLVNWVTIFQLIKAKWRIYALIIWPSLVQIMACRLFGVKPLSKPMLGYCHFGPLWTNFSEVLIKIQNFSFKCPILTTVVPGFPAIWLAVPFGANGAHLGICTLPEKIFVVCKISCFWVK